MTFKMPEPVGYLAWENDKPNWDGDDCVCEDAVYPVDYDDTRESKAIYTADQLLEVRRQTIAECAAVCEKHNYGQAPKYIKEAILKLGEVKP